MEILRSRLKSDSILPAPSTTDDSGSSAIASGRPVSSRSRLSRFFSIDPPPVSTMPRRSEEHTSELQSRENLVCRLLLEKKKKTQYNTRNETNSKIRYIH